MNLQDFLSESSSGSSVQVTKAICWNDELNDNDDYPAATLNTKIVTVSLPTAPRSSRVLDDSTIPQYPPYLAYISNLPYDATDQDVREYFEDVVDCDIVSVRLPREDGESGRMRGFGYIEFKERSHLIAAMGLPDPQIKTRKIRIDISNEHDQRRAGRGFFGGASDSGNWRRGEGSRNDGDGEYRRGGGGFGRDRERESSSDGGNWRDRPRQESSPPPPRRDNRDLREGRDRDRDRGGDRGGDRYGPRRNGYEDRPRREQLPDEERPRIVLKPRSVPLPEEKPQVDSDEKEAEPPRPKPKPVPAADIFGAARPVDTAAKDREIEERLERERQRKQKDLEEQKQRDLEDKEREPREKGEEDDGEEETAAEQDHEHKERETEAAPARAAEEKKEVSDWRRRPEQGEAEEPSREQSPPRRRFSPDRRQRRQGKSTEFIYIHF